MAIAFKVEYSCRNCGDEWVKEYEERVEVQKSVTKAVTERDKTESTGNQVSRVNCPSCNLQKHVSIENREPV